MIMRFGSGGFRTPLTTAKTGLAATTASSRALSDADFFVSSFFMWLQFCGSLVSFLAELMDFHRENSNASGIAHFVLIPVAVNQLINVIREVVCLIFLGHKIAAGIAPLSAHFGTSAQTVWDGYPSHLFCWVHRL
jgi:hypothetical protein